MKTFQDILKEHPCTEIFDTNQHIGTTNDVLSRWYNTWWGPFTDTHMQLMDDGVRYITGSRISKSWFNMMMYARLLPSAPNAVLPHTFFTLISANNLDANMVTYNGQLAIAVTPNEKFTGEICIPKIEPYWKSNADVRGCCVSCDF